MRTRFFVWPMLLGISFCAHGQWVNYPTPGAPRSKDGKVNLSAPAPRAGGKPDISGLWQVEATPLAELTAMFGDVGALAVPGDDPQTFSKYVFNVLADVKPEESHCVPSSASCSASAPRQSGRIYRPRTASPAASRSECCFLFRSRS